MDNRAPALVIIGHVGFATDRTPNGTTTYTGGIRVCRRLRRVRAARRLCRPGDTSG